MTKISFRFVYDRVVRAVWDEENAQWWFSVPDVVGVLNGQDDYTKNRNYWNYLKNKLKTENVELVSATNQLRVTVPFKRRNPLLTDFFSRLGLMERRGGGMKKIMDDDYEDFFERI